MYKFKNKKKGMNTPNKRNKRNKRNKESKSKRKRIKEHDDNIDLESLANDTIIINEAIKGLNKENKKTFRKVVSGKHKQLKKSINKLKKGKKLPIDKKQLKRSIKPSTKKKRIRSGSAVPEKGKPPPLPPRTEKGKPPPLPPRPGNDILGPKKNPPMKDKIPPKSDKELPSHLREKGPQKWNSKRFLAKNWGKLALGATGIGIATSMMLGDEPDESLFNKIAGGDDELTKKEYEDAFGPDGFDGHSWDEMFHGKDTIDFDTFHDEIGDDITEQIKELCKPDDDGNTALSSEACANYDLGSDMGWNKDLIDKLDPEPESESQ